MRASLLADLVEICGPGSARVGRPDDRVAGCRAGHVAAPATPRSVAALLRLAAERGMSVRPRGSGGKSDWGTPPERLDLIIDTARLHGMWDLGGIRVHTSHRDDGVRDQTSHLHDGVRDQTPHRHDGVHDQTPHRHDGVCVHTPRLPEGSAVVIAAGTPVAAVQAALKSHGKRLPLDPPSPGATIGGVLALNEAGPLRHRFGPPAGQALRVDLIDPSGQPVVLDGWEGVSGNGSGIITSAVLPVEDLPEARRWIVRPVSTPTEVGELVGQMVAQEFDLSGVEMDLPAAGGGSLALLLEGPAAWVTASAARLARQLGPRSVIQDTAPAWWGRYPFGGPPGGGLAISSAGPGGTSIAGLPTSSFGGSAGGSFAGLPDGSPGGSVDGSFGGSAAGSFGGSVDGSLGGPEAGSFGGPGADSFGGLAGGSGVVLRIRVRSRDLHAAGYALHDAVGSAVSIRGSAGAGVVHAVLPGGLSAARIGDIVVSLKQVLLARRGQVVVLTAPPALAADIEMARPADLF